MAQKLHRNVAAMKSVHAHLSIGNEEWDRYEETMPPPVSPRPPIQEIRAQRKRVMQAQREKFPPPTTGLQVTERQIPVNNTEIAIRVYIPDLKEQSNRLFPLVCYFHGGGYALGDLDSADLLCRETCVKQTVTVVNVDYRLSPEFPFPTGVTDSFEAVKWAVSNAPAIKADPKLGLLVGGASAGASFTAAITFLAKEDELFRTFPITGQILQIPKVCDKKVYPEKYKSELMSRFDLIDAPILNEEAILQFMQLYLPNDYDPFDIRISQLTAPSHKGLPPAYFQICGKDPLRDEGMLYEKVLKENQVPTKLDIYPGLPHGFSSFMPHLKASQKFAADLQDGIQWLLELNCNNNGSVMNM